jgi:ABC-type transport system involved in cytochrome c biogenesis permease component
LLPVVIVLYDPESVGGWEWLALAALLVAVGLAMVGTLAASVTAGLRTRNTLAPLLVAPLSLPLLVGATQVYESLTIGESPLIFLALLLAVDLALAIAGVITAPAIEEAR